MAAYHQNVTKDRKELYPAAYIHPFQGLLHALAYRISVYTLMYVHILESEKHLFQGIRDR